jgi:hypothetical protein
MTTFPCVWCGKPLQAEGTTPVRCLACDTTNDVPREHEPSALFAPSPVPTSFTEDLPSAAATVYWSEQASANPYSPPLEATSWPDREGEVRQAIGNRRVGVSEVFGHGLRAWSNHVGILFGAGFLYVVLSIAILGGMFLAILLLIKTGTQLPVLGGLIMTAQVACTFLLNGWALMCLNAARGDEVRLSQLFGAGRVFVPIALIYVASGLLTMLLTEFAAIVYLPLLLLTLLFWPAYYLILDGKSSMLQALGNALIVTRRNRLTTFLLAVVCVLIYLGGFVPIALLARVSPQEAGVVLVPVVVLLSMLLTSLVLTLWATAYLMMSDQLAPEPKQSW